MAAIMPKGTLIKAAIANTVKDPRIALPKPPPCISGGGGNSVKTARLNPDIPLEMTVQRIEKRGKASNKAQPVAKTVMKAPKAFRIGATV
jgi:hypothetical protein